MDDLLNLLNQLRKERSRSNPNHDLINQLDSEIIDLSKKTNTLLTKNDFKDIRGGYVGYMIDLFSSEPTNHYLVYKILNNEEASHYAGYHAGNLKMSQDDYRTIYERQYSKIWIIEQNINILSDAIMNTEGIVKEYYINLFKNIPEEILFRYYNGITTAINIGTNIDHIMEYVMRDDNHIIRDNIIFNLIKNGYIKDLNKLYELAVTYSRDRLIEYIGYIMLNQV